MAEGGRQVDATLLKCLLHPASCVLLFAIPQAGEVRGCTDSRTSLFRWVALVGQTSLSVEVLKASWVGPQTSHAAGTGRNACPTYCSTKL